MRVLYFDCINGAAGDMILGALLDAGAAPEDVSGALGAIGLSERLSVGTTTKRSIRATKVAVSVRPDEQPRDHRAIVELLRVAPMDERVKNRSLSVFENLARAESRIHGIPLDDVHFHEVGAVDALVDIVGTCAAIEHFTPDRIVASAIPTGRGVTHSAHGSIPVPAPAVTELLRNAVLVERGTEELVTPTGAALLATLSDSFGGMPPLRIESVGYGAGTLDTEIPNVVRVLVGEQQETQPTADQVELLETNVDDMAPELMPYVIERLMSAGALDAWVTPIMMKKGRVAMTLSVMCDPTVTKDLLDIVFSETTTLGIRIGPVERAVLDRKEVVAEIAGYRIRVKLGIRDGHVISVAPEYEDAAAAARATGLPLKDVYDAARGQVHDLR